MRGGWTVPHYEHDGTKDRGNQQATLRPVRSWGEVADKELLFAGPHGQSRPSGVAAAHTDGPETDYRAQNVQYHQQVVARTSQGAPPLVTVFVAVL